MVLLLLSVLTVGALLYGRSLRLEEARAADLPRETTVRAYIDGKQVRSYIKE